ncbi:DUF3265 domain-containing protein [Vibrio cholerae]|nr:DUF3265 domain-containing protein [Vibrio cholerae]
MAGYKANKRFKTDSQRVAFLPCVKFSDLGGVRKHRYCVAHHLSGRYAVFRFRRDLCLWIGLLRLLALC